MCTIIQRTYSLHFSQGELICVLKYPWSHIKHSGKKKLWIIKKTISFIYCMQCSISVPVSFSPNPMSHLQMEESLCEGTNFPRHWHFLLVTFVQFSLTTLPFATTRKHMRSHETWKPASIHSEKRERNFLLQHKVNQFDATSWLY